MVYIEELSNYNYSVSFMGCGPKLYDFTIPDIEKNLAHDMHNLLGDHITQFQCKANCEDIADERFPDVIALVNISIYVVFKLSANTEDCLVIMTDYMERAFIENHEVQ